MKKWLKIAGWSLFIIALIALAVYTKETINKKVLPDPEIVIHVEDENAFITENELLEKIKAKMLLYPEQKIEDLNIEKIETYIRSISQVKTTEVYQNIDGTWKIIVELRKPIARIYNAHDETYYLDSEGNTMSVTPSHTARVVVVTGAIDDKSNSISVDEIINNDSLISIRKLDDIYRISSYVCKDALFRSLIGQIHLEKNGDFILIPLVGDQKIVFGSAYSKKEVEEKFRKLSVFYKEALPYEGWTTYTEISVKYDGQIVCKKKNNTNE